MDNLDKLTKNKIYLDCVNLMECCTLLESTGFNLKLETPKGTAHCTFDYTIDLKKENDK